jgi:CheY-like chemotaxis protein
MADTPRNTVLQDALILIVDDMPQNLRLLRFILSSAGSKVLEASSVEQARLHLQTTIPDVILLDILMPETDGYTLCQELQAATQTAQIPIIFLSALNDAMDKVKAFSVGGSDYICKPFDAAEVLARVAHQVRLVRVQRELEREKQRLAKRNLELARAQEATLQAFSTMTQHLLGKVLDDKYSLEEQIGSGGFAVVYRATSLEWQRPVAVKILRPLGALQSEKRISRFRQEGISTCRVNHQNAVAILDSGTSRDGINYLVMELLNGCTLRDEFKDDKPLSLARCIQIIVPVCEVLAEAHRAGVVHRDIKPDNVFLHRGTAGEIVKVLDFGIAKLIDDEESPRDALTSPGELIGTPIYMSPEQLTGDPYDGRADVYSVGIMLYEMLAGRLPFPALRDSPLQVMLAHINKPPPRLRLVNPEIPAQVEAVVLSALAKEPAQRPTAADFLEELLAAAESALGAAELDRILNSPTLPD